MTAERTVEPSAARVTDPVTPREPALVLRAIGKRYPAEPEPILAIDHVDLEVPAGQLFGLLGPNGAGKSTTVGVCTTRIRPTTGSVRVDGVDAVVDPARVKRRIGVVTQDNTLDRACTLAENLEFHCRYFGWSAGAARDRAGELLERFRLADRARAFPTEISGGMAQRLQVARAVAHRPRLLFLDEPTAGLDPQSRIALWELVEELRRDGLTVVLTTHHMEEAERLCDRVAIIDRGRVLVDDTPERLVAEHGRDARVELRLLRPATDALLARLSAVDGVLEVGAQGTEVQLRTDDRDGVLAAVVGTVGGPGLADVSRTGSNLEAVFIALTGRDLRE